VRGSFFLFFFLVIAGERWRLLALWGLLASMRMLASVIVF
jgi:hypothetical protein